MVPSPGLDVHLDAFEVLGGDRGRPRWLITSPEYQMKRLLAEGWERIFEIVPCFRRDEVGTWHSPEFTMLEWYRANAGVEDIMRDTEQLVAAVSGGAFRVGSRSVEALPPFARITVCEAFERFAGWPETRTLQAAAHDPDSYFRVLVETVEPGIARLDRSVFLTDYPASQASLARTKPGDPRFAERFELYVAGVELCNGFGELVDAIETAAAGTRPERATSARTPRVSARRALPRSAGPRAPQRRQRARPGSTGGAQRECERSGGRARFHVRRGVGQFQARHDPMAILGLGGSCLGLPLGSSQAPARSPTSTRDLAPRKAWRSGVESLQTQHPVCLRASAQNPWHLALSWTRSTASSACWERAGWEWSSPPGTKSSTSGWP